MCKQGDTVIVNLKEPDGRGNTIAGVDRCIASIVQALQDGGIKTVAACCGHGGSPGTIVLADGRELLVAPNWKTARILGRMWPDIHGEVNIPDWALVAGVNEAVDRGLECGIDGVSQSDVERIVLAVVSAIYEASDFPTTTRRP